MPVAQFRSRARVIDLLGRQQIADVPTAIGELFKNALDAGARNAWADYWPDEEILTIRDDGLGMRKRDVLDKWLILATESKHNREASDDGWAHFADNEQKEWLKQPSYGEKGIGRLSVASLGRVTLLWTVWGNGPKRKGTLCLVHWNLFQHPTKLFEDLPIPYVEMEKIPAIEDIEKIFHDLQGNSEIQAMLHDEKWDSVLRAELAMDIGMDICQIIRGKKLWDEKLRTELSEKFSKYRNRNFASSFKVVNFPWETGTTFCVMGLSEEVSELFVQTTKDDNDPLTERHPDWIKSYHAFSTFWDPFHLHDKERDFKIYPSKSGKILTRTERFWSPEDFKRCDHHIKINVSEAGFAKGFIQFYHSKKIVYERQLPALPQAASTPGEFLVEIGYLQGKKDDSLLSSKDHTKIDQRLRHAGGFSIYLNNVRVQPYGAIDSDFAGFEQRRLKNAGRYYFSTLRMFGGVFFPSKEKTGLREKAGREGFVVNSARKGLRFWIERLFVDIADSYLGRNADREDKRIKKEEKEKKAATARLEALKKEYIEAIQIRRGWLRDFARGIKEQVRKTRELLASEANGIPGFLFPECEKNVKILQDKLDELRSAPSRPPEGVVIEGDALMGIEDFITNRENEIANLSKEIAEQIKKLHILAIRFQNKKEQEKEISEKIFSADRNIQSKIKTLLAPAMEKAKTLERELKTIEASEIREVMNIREGELANITIKEIAQDTTGELVKHLESSFQKQQEFFERKIAPRLRILQDDILHLTDRTSGSFILSEQAEELQVLKEQHSFLIELAQLGLVFETANHEYENHVNSIRDSIALLHSKVESHLNKAVNTLSDSFDIIDERIRMFDPLIRRRSSSIERLTGEEIEDFVNRRFKEYTQQRISIEFTKNFKNTTWKNLKRPIFLGAIHNIVHNAFFWAHKGRSNPKIRFSSSGRTLTISDSGPGINELDSSRIFEPGFSRRPDGRGLGLYIARESLHGIGFDLFCPKTAELGALEGANFTIIDKKEQTYDD